MTINDLKLLKQPLYFPKVDYLDLSAFLFNTEKKNKQNYSIIIKELCPINYKFVYELVDGDKDTISDMILWNLFKYNGIRKLEAPIELQARLHILKQYAEDFTLYPTYYTQEFLDIIKSYTVQKEGFSKSIYTFESLANKIFGCELNFVDSINLKTPNNNAGRGLGEVYIAGAGICILPSETLQSLSSRDTILGLRFKPGEGLNIKLDARKVQSKHSILDWRDNDSKGFSGQIY